MADVNVVRFYPFMYYLTGYDTTGYSQFQCLFLGADGNLVLLTQSADLRQARLTSVSEDIRIWVDHADSNPGLDLRQILEEQGCRGNVLNLLPADVHFCSAFPKPIYIFLSMTLRALDVGEARGFMKAMVHADTDQILGAAMLCIEGGEIMAIVEVAMMGNLPYTALRGGIFPHPALAEALNSLFAAIDYRD